MALATLINVAGSSYRREGARLLIGRDGSHAGSISGGCLEAEVIRKMRWLIRQGATIERYSTIVEEDAEIPYGLGCGGVVDVLIEPAGTPEFEAILQAMAASLEGQFRQSEVRFDRASRRLSRRVLDAHGSVLFRSEVWNDTEAELYREVLVPPQRLFVIGAGDDAQPMVRLGALIGWTVYVFDGRASLARRERFPEAEQVFAGEHFTTIHPNAEDVVVLMTHSYEQDRNWLQQILPYRPRYIGLLGSRHRSALLADAVSKALRCSVAEVCASIFSPVGLDLGGDGAEAIALSAVAEIQACTQGTLGGSRRLTPDVVSEQIARGGYSSPAVKCAL